MTGQIQIIIYPIRPYNALVMASHTYPEVELPPVAEAPVTLEALAHCLPPVQEVVVGGGLQEGGQAGSHHMTCLHI